MGRALSNILNALQIVLSLALTATAIWFYVEVQSIAGLRNRNHYLLDYNVYWPQAIPLLVLFAGIIAVCASCCGFVAALKRNKHFALAYVVLQAIAIVVLLVAAILAFAFVNSDNTKQFLIDTIYDVFGQSKTDVDVRSSYEIFEKRLQCCGAYTPRDYVGWRTDFPISCCDTYYHGWIGSYNIDCDFSNKSANGRFGCSEVAVQYTRITIMVLASVSLLIAVIGVINLFAAVTLLKGLRKMARRRPPHQEETNRVLL